MSDDSNLQTLVPHHCVGFFYYRERVTWKCCFIRTLPPLCARDFTSVLLLFESSDCKLYGMHPPRLYYPITTYSVSYLCVLALLWVVACGIWIASIEFIYSFNSTLSLSHIDTWTLYQILLLLAEDWFFSLQGILFSVASLVQRETNI